MNRPWLAHYEAGTPACIDVPAYPITQNLVENVETRPDQPALIYGSVVEPLSNALLDRTMSCRQLLNLTERFAGALQQLGIRKGDRVVVHLPNCPQFVIAYYATLMVGGIVVPCSPECVARELTYQLNDSGAETIITLSLTYPLVRQIRPETSLKHAIVTNVKEYFPWPLKALFTAFREKKEGHRPNISDDTDTYWLQDLLRRTANRPAPVHVDMEDTAVLMYTGGTTGTIKGAQLTHRNLQANAVQVRAWFPSLHEGEEMILAALPLFHSYGMTTCMNLGIRTRTPLILIVNPRALAHILKSVSKHRPSAYPGVPAFYVAIVNCTELQEYDLSSIKFCISGAAPLPTQIQQRFEQCTGGRLVEGYGLSEATPVTHANPIYGENRPGTIGLPLPSTDARIVDLQTGTQDLAPGEAGELIVRGPQVMKGYWRKPTETTEVLRDGWLYTGDIACMDEDGYFRILDRKKDLILGSGGQNIYPSELEDTLRQHPHVKECAAIGVPAGPEKGERVKVLIVPQEGERVTEDEILAFCRKNLAPFKVPKFVELRRELPKTMVGKVLRRALTEDGHPLT